MDDLLHRISAVEHSIWNTAANWILGAEWGPILDVAAVILPIVLGVVGVIVSTIHLETPASKFWWRGAVIALGFVAAFVAYEQQIVARSDAEKTTKEQVKLAKQEQAARYVPAGFLVYENHRLTFYNKTKSTLYVWAAILDGISQNFGTVPDIVPIDANVYFIVADSFEEKILLTIGPDGRETIPFEIYFKNELGVKYVSKFDLLIITKSGKVEIHTQMHSFDPQDW